jgi:hypothetical protein
VELFLALVVAIATVVGTIGSLILTHRGNKHFEEQNRIMIEQGGGKAPQAKAYKPPSWPLIAMLGMVLLCWGAAAYDYIGRYGGSDSSTTGWKDYPFKRIEHQHYHNETVTLDGNEYIDVTFENVTFMYQGKAPTRFDGIHIVLVKPGELAGRLGSDNPAVVQTLAIATAIDAAGGCNAKMTPR